MSKIILPILIKALQEAKKRPSGESFDIPNLDEFNILKFEELMHETRISTEVLLSKAAIIAAREKESFKERKTRDALDFITSKRSVAELTYTEKSKTIKHLDISSIKASVISANESIELIHDLAELYGIGFFHILGMRNLSAFIGELFVRAVHKHFTKDFIKNPNQDGYPDLCALTPEGNAYIESNKNEDGKVKCDKELWSPFPYGGIEIKATCGNTPPASKVPKPLIGESRLPILVNAEWKAHHQLTKILLGIYWDFVDGLPTILAVFFRNDLYITP